MWTRIEVEGAIAVQVVPLGAWPARALANPQQIQPWPVEHVAKPEAFSNPPRRCLVYARFPDTAPDRLHVVLTPGAAPTRASIQPAALPFRDRAVHVHVVPGSETYHSRNHQHYHYVKREDAVRIEGLGRKLTLRLGWRIGHELRYWQWVQAIPAWDGPVTSAVTVGGHIYAGPIDRSLTLKEANRVEHTLFYQESTLSAKAFLILHHDGLIELTTHFANTQAYGNGCAVQGLPVVEIIAPDGLTSDHLHPNEGRLECVDAGCTWRWMPLDSSHIYLGHRCDPDTGKIIEEAAAGSDTAWLEGVARSASCRIGLAHPPAAPRRYLAPPSWYLRCGEFGLPLPSASARSSKTLEKLAKAAASVFLRNIHREGMCRGGVYRYLDELDGRHELSMDGNEVASLFRGAYLQGSPPLYEAALEAARFIADIAIDHNYFNVHYHGDSPTWRTFSMIYLRFGGLVPAWQETGDPWYLELAEAVASRWIALNRMNQPRQNMGRDAEPVEGILMLYDATGKDHYFQEAERIALDVMRSLSEDHDWRSGHGVGPYWGVNALRGTPWNGSHLLAGIAEFLCRACPDTSPHFNTLLQAARGLVRTLLAKLRQEYDGFHRAAGALLPRRHFLVAWLANDTQLMAQIDEAVQRIEQAYAQQGEAFFKAGHHCAGYLEAPMVFHCLRQTRDTPEAAFAAQTSP